MKRLLITISILAVLLCPFLAKATPGIPYQFYGSVEFSGVPAPDGLVVEARIDGQVVASASIVDGQYGFSPSLFFVTDPEGNRQEQGDRVEFFISGIDTERTVPFVNGGYSRIDFSLSGSVGTIEWGEDEVIENETVAVAPSTFALTYIEVGDSLNLTISSEVSTNATINKIEKLTSDFFTGTTAIIAGNNLLNAFEIDITGDDLNISVTITYDDTGIDESTVKPYKFNGTWVPITDYNQNTSANTITFSISSAQTPYAVFGEPVAPDPAPSPPPSPPSDGGGATPISPVTPIPLSEAAKRADTNQDDRIDIFDFNTLMVNWGSAVADNVADFDDNGTVDVFDFNLLMIYWTG